MTDRGAGTGRFGTPAGCLALPCIAWLVERGVPVPVVQRFAGHGSVEVTMLYAHVAPDVYATEVRRALGSGA